MSQVTSSRVLLLGTDAGVNPASGAPIAAAGVTTGTSRPIARENDGILSFYLRSIGTTSGGTILIEEADWGDGEKDYAGTWSVVATVLANSFTGGAQLAVHIADCSYGYVRVRISSDITGGGAVMASLRSRGAM